MNRIAELRKLNNLSQRELASAVGVSDISVSKWENGKTYPTGENLRRLAEILHCEPEDILQDIKKEPQNSFDLTAAEKRLIDVIRELPEDRSRESAHSSVNGDLIKSISSSRFDASLGDIL